MIKRQKEKERKENEKKKAVSFDFSTGYRSYKKTKSLSAVE